MIVISGKRYITDKEASSRYGYSQSWFKQRRKQKLPPRCINYLNKVLYEQDLLDQWFVDQIKLRE